MITEKEELIKIGERIQRLRVKSGSGSYEAFAIQHGLSRMQYWKIEKGLTNITMRSLINILNIHKVTLEDFFAENF